jgi:hypothetical protein
MSFEPRDFLRHILVEADYLIDRRAGVSSEVFVADETLRRGSFAVLRSLARPRGRPRLVWDVV